MHRGADISLLGTMRSQSPSVLQPPLPRASRWPPPRPLHCHVIPGLQQAAQSYHWPGVLPGPGMSPASSPLPTKTQPTNHQDPLILPGAQPQKP